jgi:hypothetical protein
MGMFPTRPSVIRSELISTLFLGIFRRVFARDPAQYGNCVTPENTLGTKLRRGASGQRGLFSALLYEHYPP